MSRLPAAFLSYTAPADYIDNVGRHPPVVRVNIQLPREYVDHGGAVGDPPHQVQPISPETLADIQNQVLRQTSGAARQFLGAFRQGRDIGGLNIVGRSCILADGIGMSYTSQFGMERVNINVTPEAVRRLIGESGGGYLLVLYEGNKIAWANMANIVNIKKNDFKKRTLVESGWPSTPGFATQLKTSISNHFLSAELSITKKGVITAGDARYYDTQNSLLKMSDHSTYIIGDSLLFNCMGNRLYTVDGYTLVADGEKGLKTYTYKTNISGLGMDTCAIGSDNSRYSKVNLRNAYSELDVVSTAQGFITTQQEDAYHRIYDPWAAAPALYRYYPTWNYSGPGDADFYGNYPFTTDPAAVQTYNNTASFTQYFMVYSNDGFLDKIVVSGVPGSATSTSVSGGSVSSSINYMHYSGAVTDSSMSGMGRFAMWAAYHLGSERGQFYLQMSSSGSATDDITTTTPYGDYTGVYLVPWAHISNGRHYLQMFDLEDVFTSDTTRKIFLNKKDYGDKLAKAIGCDISDIQFIFFDIKLDDISKLK